MFVHYNSMQINITSRFNIYIIIFQRNNRIVKEKEKKTKKAQN